MKKNKKEQDKANFQILRLLLIMGRHVEVWFLLKLEILISVNTTIIHTVTDCSDLKQIEQIISVLEVVRKDTYNVIGSISFWGVSWMKAVPIMSEKGFTASKYYIGSKQLPSKIFEWTVNDTAKNIIAQQEAAKKAVIVKIYQAFPILESSNLTEEQQLIRKTDRITSIGISKNKLWSLANIKLKDKNPLKAKRIVENNLNNKTELKRRNRDDSYVETIVNTSVKIATQLTEHLIYEDLTTPIQDRRKHLSRRAKNRLHHWQKGTVVERLKVWANRNHTHLTCINCAYSSQVDAATGTLLGSRSGDRFIRYTGVELQADQNAAEVIRLRAHDHEIMRYMKFEQVQYVLLCRTKAFLKTLGLSLDDAVSRGWLDNKHTHHKKYKELLLG